MLLWRLLLGTLIIAALLGLCCLDTVADLPGVYLIPVLMLLTVLGTQEVLRLAEAGGMRPEAGPVYVGNLLIVMAQWMPAVYLYRDDHITAPNMGLYDFMVAGTRSPMWAVALAVLMVFVGEMRRYEKPGGTLANIAVGIFALVYVGVMFAFAVQIRLFWGVGAIASWIIPVKMGDIGAYTVGRLIGRHKMSPTISPGKTIEGAVGAFVFAVIGSWACFTWLTPHVPHQVATPPGLPGGWLVYGIVMGAVGMLGDLAESLLKRDVGCKDSSSWMPGFGGVLDILDSLLLSAPLAWLCWSLGIVGTGLVE